MKQSSKIEAEYQGLRKALLQIDRKQTRKKAKSLLKQEERLQSSQLSSSYILGEIMVNYCDHNYAETIRLCKVLMDRECKDGAVLFCMELLLELYQQMDLQEEYFKVARKLKRLKLS